MQWTITGTHQARTYEIDVQGVPDCPPATYRRDAAYVVRPDRVSVTLAETTGPEGRSRPTMSVRAWGRRVLKSGALQEASIEIHGLYSEKDWPDWLRKIVDDVKALAGVATGVAD